MPPCWLRLLGWLACWPENRDMGLDSGLAPGRTGFNTPSQEIQSLIGIKLIKDERLHIFMMFGRMVLGVAICNVSASRGPQDAELFLIYSIADPVESHINSFGALLFDCAIHDACGHRVISGDWGGGLWVAHFGKCHPEDGAVFGVVE